MKKKLTAEDVMGKKCSRCKSDIALPGKSLCTDCYVRETQK